MYFKRKAYDRLLEWKAKYSDKYAALLEGVKRVGKSTIAESFGQNEYKSYLLIDFSKTTDNIRSCFEDVGNLNMFFLRLQAETGVTLYEHESLIIFDEVQLFPQARQAIKHLVAPTTVEEVNKIILEASESPELKGILGYNELPLVSSDFNHTSFSSIFDATLTKVIDGTLVKAVAWYDNEWGFSCRMLDTAVAMYNAK